MVKIKIPMEISIGIEDSKISLTYCFFFLYSSFRPFNISLVTL